MLAGSAGEFKGTDRFMIRRRLGAGGMGVVYEAYDRLARQEVALKTVVCADASALYRLKNEFRSLADIAHPNLVSLFELFMEAGVCFFTMELVDGVNFLSYTTDTADCAGGSPGANESTLSFRPVPIGPAASDGRSERSPTNAVPVTFTVKTPARADRLRAALRQVVEGLCTLHDSGKLHRDIKPSNMLVTPAGRAVILDFGLSTDLFSTANGEMGGFAGTPAYMSPEQYAGGSLSPASDWYSLGVTLYEVLAGRLPFGGQYLDAVSKKLEMDPAPPSGFVTDVPEDLEELCLDLLRRDPIERPGGHDILSRLTGKESPAGGASKVTRRGASFVGREGHLATLWQAFSTLQGDSPVRVFIRGNSGMGKSTLVRAFLKQLEEREQVLILTGRCYERESIPYKALDGVIDNLSRDLASLPAARVEALLPRDVAALARMFPVLQRVEAIAQYPFSTRHIPDPLTLRRRAFSALRELLGRISDRRRLVIFIDDLHWSDADSMALLGDLCRPPDAPVLLLLATFRSEAVETLPLLRNLLDQAGSNDCYQLSLQGLTDAEARRLLGSMLDTGTSVAGGFVETVVKEARGNPFLIEQLACWAASVTESRRHSVSVGDMLEARLNQLPEGARPILEALAIATHPIPAEVLFQAAGHRENAQSLIAFLRSTNFLRSTGMAQTVELYHDRIRETIAALMSPDDVRRIHQSLAESLLAAGVDDPEVMFEHYTGAGRFELASRYAVLAARKATAALAFDRAAAFYRRALQLTPLPFDEMQRLKAELGDALANAGRSAEAASAYLDAADRVAPNNALDLQRRAAEQLLLGGHVDEGLNVMRTVLDRVGLKLASGTASTLISLLLRRLQLRLRGLHFSERPASSLSQEEMLRIDICWAVAAGLAMVDNTRGAEFQTRHLLLSLRAGEPYRIARALAVEAGFSATSGAPGRRRAEYFSRMAERLSTRVGHAHAIGLAKLTEGVAAFLVGEWTRALHLCEAAEEILRDQCTGVLWELTSAQNFLLGSLLYLGDVSDIARRLPVLLTTASERGNLYAVTEIKTRMNFIWLANDDPEGARREVAEALQRWSHKGFHRQHYNAILAEAQIALYVGDGRTAWECVNARWPELRRAMLLRIQALRIEALFLKGRCALALAFANQRKAQRFRRQGERIAHAIERERMPWSNPLAWLLQAGLRRDQSEKAHLLSQAVSAFERAEMALHAAVARWRLGEVQDSKEGDRLVEEAGTWMVSHGIKNPACMVRLLAPGFPKRSRPNHSRPQEPESDLPR